MHGISFSSILYSAKVMWKRLVITVSHGLPCPLCLRVAQRPEGLV